jgi:hypothetical protein
MKTLVKLKILDTETTWTQIVEDLAGNVLWQNTQVLHPENRNKQYFDDWEAQIRQFPDIQVVQVERFI